MLPYKVSQLDKNERLTYDESLGVCFPGKKIKHSEVKANTSFHLGQLKLFYAELLFLTKYAQKGDLVLYVGAAPGYHTNKMAQLFPNLEFHLYDKQRFDINEKYIKSGQITLFKEYFEDSTTDYYAKLKRRILFVCDMRDLKIGKYKGADHTDNMDIIVTEDMYMQMKWCQMIKPFKAYLKFRLPYQIEETRYLTGTIYLQAYNAISTETRLCTDNYTSLTTYNNEEFDEMLAYHNAMNRCESKEYPQYDVITKKYGILNNWDNCFALMIIGNYLKEQGKDPSPDAIGKLFIDVYKFHRARYGEKYDAIMAK